MKNSDADLPLELRRRVAIIGAGSWGTSVARVIAQNRADHEVCLWAYEKQVVRSINEARTNAMYLPDVALPANVSATGSLRDAVAGSYMVFLATPSKVLYDTCLKLRKFLEDDARLAYLTKGFCRVGEGIYTISEAIEMALPSHGERLAAVYGPSHAEEVSREFHTCLNVASKSLETREEVASLLRCAFLECRELEDIRGVELGGTLKNPAAIAAGMLSVLPACGDNLAGALMSEALKEMLRIGEALGAKSETILDIAGLGDLIATSLSDHSRNRRFGKDIGRQILRTGKSVGFLDRIVLRFKPEYVLEKMSRKLHYLAEGAYAIEPLIELAMERDIDIPVYRALYEILLHNREPRLLVETVKNPDRFDEILRETRLHITHRKKGMERSRGTFFANVIAKNTAGKFMSDPALAQELESYRNAVDTSSGHGGREGRLLAEAAGAGLEKAVTSLSRAYLGGMTDRFSPFAAFVVWGVVAMKNAMANLFRRHYGKGIFRSNIAVGGGVDVIHRLSSTATLLYAARCAGRFDFLFYGLAFRKSRLMAPRFFMHEGALRGAFRRMLFRLAGGYVVDVDRVDNPVYRETLKSYLSILLQHGVPVLFFPEISATRPGDPVAIRDDILDLVFESLYQSTEEIAVVPLEMSYYRMTGAGREGDSVSIGAALHNTVAIHFSDPIPLSFHSHRRNFHSEVLSLIRYRWKKDAVVLPHYLFCRILKEHGYAMRYSELKRTVKEFLKKHGMADSFRARDVVKAGADFIQRNGIGFVESNRVVITSHDEVDYFADCVR